MTEKVNCVFNRLSPNGTKKSWNSSVERTSSYDRRYSAAAEKKFPAGCTLNRKENPGKMFDDCISASAPARYSKKENLLFQPALIRFTSCCSETDHRLSG